jgi:hypothetical protein
MRQRAIGEGNNTQPEKAQHKKVQFDFSPDTLKRLETLKTRVDAPTMAEVVRNALKVYEWIITQIDSEYTLEIQDEKGKPVFRIPAKVLL